MTADDNDFDVFPSEVCLVSRNAKTSSTPVTVEKMPSLHKTVKATVLRSLAVLDFSVKARFMMHEEKKIYHRRTSPTGVGERRALLSKGVFPSPLTTPHWRAYFRKKQNCLEGLSLNIYFSPPPPIPKPLSKRLLCQAHPPSIPPSRKQCGEGGGGFSPWFPLCAWETPCAHYSHSYWLRLNSSVWNP